MEVELTEADLVVRIGSGSDTGAEAELLRRDGAAHRLYGLRHLRNAHTPDLSPAHAGGEGMGMNGLGDLLAPEGARSPGEARESSVLVGLVRPAELRQPHLAVLLDEV